VRRFLSNFVCFYNKQTIVYFSNSFKPRLIGMVATGRASHVKSRDHCVSVRLQCSTPVILFTGMSSVFLENLWKSRAVDCYGAISAGPSRQIDIKQVCCSWFSLVKVEIFCWRVCCCSANRPVQSVWFPSSADGIICSFHDYRRSGGQRRQDADESSEDENWPTKTEEGREVEADGGWRVSTDHVSVFCHNQSCWLPV